MTVKTKGKSKGRKNIRVKVKAPGDFHFDGSDTPEAPKPFKVPEDYLPVIQFAADGSPVGIFDNTIKPEILGRYRQLVECQKKSDSEFYGLFDMDYTPPEPIKFLTDKTTGIGYLPKSTIDAIVRKVKASKRSGQAPPDAILNYVIGPNPEVADLQRRLDVMTGLFQESKREGLELRDLKETYEAEIAKHVEVEEDLGNMAFIASKQRGELESQLRRAEKALEERTRKALQTEEELLELHNEYNDLEFKLVREKGRSERAYSEIENMPEKLSGVVAPYLKKLSGSVKDQVLAALRTDISDIVKSVLGTNKRSDDADQTDIDHPYKDYQLLVRTIFKDPAVSKEDESSILSHIGRTYFSSLGGSERCGNIVGALVDLGGDPIKAFQRAINTHDKISETHNSVSDNASAGESRVNYITRINVVPKGSGALYDYLNKESTDPMEVGFVDRYFADANNAHEEISDERINLSYVDSFFEDSDSFDTDSSDPVPAVHDATGVLEEHLEGRYHTPGDSGVILDEPAYEVIQTLKDMKKANGELKITKGIIPARQVWQAGLSGGRVDLNSIYYKTVALGETGSKALR